MPDSLFYLTGKPCRRGHVSLRYVKTRTCVTCAKNTMAIWREKNHDRYLQKQRIRQRSQNVARKVRNAIRRDILRGAKGVYTEEDVDALMKKQRNICAAPHCEEDIEHSYHIDHVDPISNGGTNWPNNLQLLCCSCNCSKGAKNYGVWILEKASAAR